MFKTIEIKSIPHFPLTLNCEQFKYTKHVYLVVIFIQKKEKNSIINLFCDEKNKI